MGVGVEARRAGPPPPWRPRRGSGAAAARTRRPAATRAARRPRRSRPRPPSPPARGAHRLEHVEGHGQVVVERRRRVLPGAPDVGLRGEVVDDVGRRPRRPRARVGVRLGQVDAARRRGARATTSSPAAAHAAARWRPAKPVPPVIRTRAHAGGDDQVLEVAVAVGRRALLVGRAPASLGRVQPALQLAEHDAEEQVPPRRLRRTRARLPNSFGNCLPAGCSACNRVSGQVPRCSAIAGRDARGRPGRAAGGDALRVQRAEHRPVGDVHRDPAGNVAGAARGRA